VPTPTPDLADLASASARLERLPASSAVAWAWERYGRGCVLTASFQDCVLLDIAVQVAPDVEVVFLDTQYHFAETLEYVEQVRQRYDLNLTVVEPVVAMDDRWRFDQNGCCRSRKVEPLRRALEGRDAWITGLRRSEAPNRAAAPIVSWDLMQDVVKVNPLASWSDHDVELYVKDHDLPVHPLTDDGYSSIGCWPCTRPVAPGEHARAGRWSGTDKTECGIHGEPDGS
jgi:phosphoadenosine phosphosulfate reductase